MKFVLIQRVNRIIDQKHIGTSAVEKLVASSVK
jgi:hypothetical protein